MTLIHVNVDEDVYGYLSKRAEDIEKSVGQYCSELLTIWSAEEALPETTPDDAETIRLLREANKHLEEHLEELTKAYEEYRELTETMKKELASKDVDPPKDVDTE